MRPTGTGVLAVLLLGFAGTSADLLLLAHYEELDQLIPLVLAGLAVGALAWATRRPQAGAILALQAVMTLVTASGLLGVVLHYNANAEFQLEVDPTLQGAALFWKVVSAKAPPALAPGVMVQLGALGLVYGQMLKTWQGERPTRA